MIIKFAAFISGTALVLSAALAQANVPDSFSDKFDLADAVRSVVLDQSPSILQCEIDIPVDPFRPPSMPKSQDDHKDIFIGDASFLDEKFAVNSCQIPIRSLDPFRNVARR